MKVGGGTTLFLTFLFYVILFYFIPLHFSFREGG